MFVRGWGVPVYIDINNNSNTFSGFLHSAHIRHSVMLKALQHSVFPARYTYVCGTSFELWNILLYKAPCNGCSGTICSQLNQGNWGEPPFLSISPLGSKDEASWLNVLKDTCVMNGTRTHSLLIRNCLTIQHIQCHLLWYWMVATLRQSVWMQSAYSRPSHHLILSSLVLDDR